MYVKVSIEAKSTDQINELSITDESYCNDYKSERKCELIKTSSKNEKELNEVDHLLENIVGGGGWGQWLILLCLFPIGMASGLPMIIQMFAAYEPRHRCFVPNCDGISNNLTQTIFQKEFIQYALPKDYGSSEMFRVDENFDPCSMNTMINEATTCSASAFDNSSTIKCSEFVYDTSEFTETLTTKFDLVCGDESKRRLLGTIMMLGFLIGSLIGGRLSDKFGRKITMLISHTILTPVVMFGGFSPNYTTYAVLRLVSASCLPPMWICIHSLVLELFGKEYRKSVAMVKDLMGPICLLTLVLIIYNVRHWMFIHLYIGVACLVAFPCYLVVPESPRWLALNGKRRAAEKILLTIAKRNGNTLSEDNCQEIKNTLEYMEKDAHKTKGQENLNPLDMVRSGHLTKTLILLLNWVTVCVGSYTLILNSTKLSGDLFLNYILLALVGDIPGTVTLLITLKYFSRRFNLFYTQFILGICCVILAFLPKTSNIAITCFFLIGKCFAGTAFLLVWLITAELYPTNLRSQAVGTCSTVARAFGLIAPFVARLGVYWKPLPMLLLGIPCIFAACMAFFLPETKDIELPTTMKDADELEKSKTERSIFLKRSNKLENK